MVSGIPNENIDIKAQHEETLNKKQTKELASNYFKDVIEEELSDVLMKCINTRPDNPLQFVADELEKWVPLVLDK